MTLDLSAIIQTLMGLAIAGLVADHFRLRKEVATIEKNALNSEFMREVRAEFFAIRTDLQKLATDLAFLKGQQASHAAE